MSLLVLPEMEAVWRSTLGWQPSAIEFTQFQQLYTLIVDKNQQLNLTRITEPEAFWEKHLWDSLKGIEPWLRADGAPDKWLQEWLQEWLQDSQATNDRDTKVIDIGTGAGFPGLPVAIVRPHWHLTLLDSTRKRTAFLDAAIESLALDRVQTLTERVEAVGQQPQHREQYDLALIRAVAGATVCAEYALPLLQVGGIAVLYRGQWTEAEAIALSAAVPQLGGKVLLTVATQTPLNRGVRHCIYLKKETPTPKTYPRSIGVAAQKPI